MLKFFNCINNCKIEETGSSTYENASSFCKKYSNMIASCKRFNPSFNVKAYFCTSKNGSIF